MIHKNVIDFNWCESFTLKFAFEYKPIFYKKYSNLQKPNSSLVQSILKTCPNPISFIRIAASIHLDLKNNLVPWTK